LLNKKIKPNLKKKVLIIFAKNNINVILKYFIVVGITVPGTAVPRTNRVPIGTIVPAVIVPIVVCIIIAVVLFVILR